MELRPENRSRVPSSVLAAMIGLVVTGWIVFDTAAHASISFNYDYSNNTAGVGFLDSTDGAARRSALTSAGNMFSNMFGQHFNNMGTITLEITSADNSNSGTLASAGSMLVDNGPGFAGEVVRTKLQTGADLNGADADGIVDVNWGWNWELDPNTPASSADEEFDFYSTVFHEFTHALGFGSVIDEDGSLLFGNQYTLYDSFLVDKDGNRIVDTNNNRLNQSIWVSASVGGTGNGVFFDGAEGVGANGGTVDLYSPETWEEGSSVSHLDKELFPDAMMKHDRKYGDGEARDYNVTEVGMLTDLGYTPVPVPETLTLLLTGLGALFGWRFRRCKE